MGNNNSLFVQLEHPSYYGGDPMAGQAHMVVKREVAAKAVVLRIKGRAAHTADTLLNCARDRLPAQGSVCLSLRSLSGISHV
jgi:hypothetical protein